MYFYHGKFVKKQKNGKKCIKMLICAKKLDIISKNVQRVADSLPKRE